MSEPEVDPELVKVLTSYKLSVKECDPVLLSMLFQADQRATVVKRYYDSHYSLGSENGRNLKRLGIEADAHLLNVYLAIRGEVIEDYSA
jgi:hypothetical protein